MNPSRRLGELDSSPREENTPSSLPKKEAVDGERDEAADRFDPEHPAIVEDLADPGVDSWSNGLTEKDEEAARKGEKGVVSRIEEEEADKVSFELTSRYSSRDLALQQ